MNEIYFENICEIGNLCLEKVFNKFEDENIIFICTDKDNNKYLCLCYEFRFSLKWVISKIAIKDIARLILGIIDIRNIFELEADNLIHIAYQNNTFTCERLKIDQLKESALPRKSVFLRTDEGINTYLYNLCFTYLISKKYSFESYIDYDTNVKYPLNNMEPVYYSGATSMSYNVNSKSQTNKEYSYINIDDAA